MTQAETTRRTPRRWRWWVGALVVVVLVVLAGPTLVGLSPLPGVLLADALPPSAGTLSAGRVGLSWTGPITAAGLQLRDAEGATLFSADRVAVEGGLLGLVAAGDTPLSVEVQRPRVDLVMGPKGTNFDRVVAALAAKRDAAQSAEGDNPATPALSRPLSVRVADGAVLVTDASSDAQWLLDGLQVEVDDPARGVNALEVTAAGRLGRRDAADGERGDFTLRLGAAEGGGRLAKVAAAGLPLSLATPLLGRIDPTADVDGRVSVEGEAAWRPQPGAVASDLSPAGVLRTLAAGGVRSSGLAKLSGVRLTAAATRGGPAELATIDLPWRLAAEGDGVALQQLDLTSDIGRVAVTGTVTAGEVERWATGLAAAPRDLQVAGRIDLDRLARSAPQLLQLQRGARLESGRVEARADFQAGRLAATLKTGPLAGVAEGRRVEWREPLDVQLAAVQQAPAAGLAGWTLESLKAVSSFLTANASGDATRLTGGAEFDLDRLAGELAPLVDLGEARLTGAGQARFDLARDADARRWRLASTGNVRDLLVGPPAAPLAEEPRLDFQADLQGDLAAAAGLPVGTLKLTAGDDNLAVTLPDAEADDAQAFELRLSGDLTHWFRRLKVVSPNLPRPEAIALAGDVDLFAAGVAGAAGGRVDRVNLVLKRLGFDTDGLAPSAPRVRLADERVEASAVATWSVADRDVRVAQGTLVSSVASARLRDVVVSLGAPEDSRGEALYRLDLGRLDAWLPPRDGPPRYAARGAIEGSAAVRGVPEGLAAKLRVDGTDLTLLDRQAATAEQATVWAEPRLAVTADVLVVPTTAAGTGQATYAVDLRDARVESRSLNGSFGGRIADAVALRGVELGGGVDYDLEQLTPMLWPTLGAGVRLVGRDRATFRIETDESAPAGAAPIARLRGRVAAPWQGADLFGLPVGAGRLAVTLERGVARTEPIDVAIGGGRLTAQAAASLDPPPATLTLRPGPLVTEVAVSQEVNERVLKFIAPVLADATRIDGRFSLSLSDFAVPLAPPPASGPPPGRAAGVLDIHQVRVRPGPAVAEWVAVVKQIAGAARDGVESIGRPDDSVLVAVNDSAIDFQLVDGRVYHRGLVFNVGDARVESSGSVGVDETLDLVLAVPILDEWIDRRPQYLGRLRGQALRIPVSGTFKKPKINSDAFRQLSGQLIESAAAGALEGGLNRLLEKLRSR